MSLEALQSHTDPAKLVEALKIAAQNTPGACTESDPEGTHFALGYLASYVCMVHKEAAEAEAEDRSFTNDELYDMMLTVPVADLERVAERRRVQERLLLADDPSELDS